MRDGIIEGLHRELLGVRNARDANHDEKMRFENIAANQMEHVRQLKHRVDELTEALRDKPRPPISGVSAGGPADGAVGAADAQASLRVGGEAQRSPAG